MSESNQTEQKQQLRRKVLARRRQGHDCSHAHSQLLIDLAWEQRAKTIACFISFGDEPSTNVFIKHCQLDETVTLYVPRVVGENLEWVEFNEEQIRHPLGMTEPVGSAIALDSVDLMVIPALAVDHFGHRLGRGRGFYDRALTQIDSKVTVAAVHDDEFLKSVPFEQHDQKVDGVCTCSEVHFIKS